MKRTSRCAIGLAIWIGSISLGGLAEAATPRVTENVLWIMTDGLRWQEVFAGAEEILMTEENGGVEAKGRRIAEKDVLARYARSPARGPHALFLERHRPPRAGLRQSKQGQHCPRDQWHELFLSRLQRDVVRLCRPADRQQRQAAESERHGAGMDAPEARLSGTRGRLWLLGRFSLYFQPAAVRFLHQRRL